MRKVKNLIAALCAVLPPACWPVPSYAADVLVTENADYRMTLSQGACDHPTVVMLLTAGGEDVAKYKAGWVTTVREGEQVLCWTPYEDGYFVVDQIGRMGTLPRGNFRKATGL